MRQFGPGPSYHDQPCDPSVYTPSDLPPHVLHKIAQRNSSLDTSPVTPEIETFTVHHTGLPSQYHSIHHGDRDSGIDVTCPEFRSEWSQSSTSSTTIPNTFYQGPPVHGLSIEGAQGHLPAFAEMPYQPSTTASQPAVWHAPKLEHEPSQYWQSHPPLERQDCYNPGKATPTAKYIPLCDQVDPRGYGNLHGRGPISRVWRCDPSCIE